MKFKKIKQNSLRFLGNLILVASVNVLCKSLRVTYENKTVIDILEQENKRYVFAFWHGTMLLPWYLNRNKNFVALISKSKDGDLLAKVLKSWNYTVIRGSSSMGGEVALGIMIDYAKNNRSIAITPDGPRGPIQKLKAGAVITAKKSGLPLIMVGTGYNKKKELKSWDKFQVPVLFSKAKAVFSEPLYIKRDLNYDETSAIIEECEMKLNELQKKAEYFEP